MPQQELVGSAGRASSDRPRGDPPHHPTKLPAPSRVSGHVARREGRHHRLQGARRNSEDLRRRGRPGEARPDPGPARSARLRAGAPSGQGPARRRAGRQGDRPGGARRRSLAAARARSRRPVLSTGHLCPLEWTKEPSLDRPSPSSAADRSRARPPARVAGAEEPAGYQAWPRACSTSRRFPTGRATPATARDRAERTTNQ